MSVAELFQILGNAGEFLGSIGVLVTLVYLAIQIKQNSEQVRLNSYQTHLERYGGLISHVLQDSDRFETFQRALNSYDSCAPHQQAMFHSHLMNGINAILHSRELANAGSLPEKVLLDHERDLARIFKSPGGKQWMESFGIGPESEVLEGVIGEVLRVGVAEPPLNELLPFLREPDVAEA